MSSATITLTTDFGTSDGYVGTMKGVALRINPDVALVDISHDIPPQDVAHGAFVLGTAYRYFHPDAVHVGVVDPGVGTSRRALLMVTPVGRFIVPDNGLLTYVLADQHHRSASGPDTGTPAGKFMAPSIMPVPEGCAAYALTKAEYWLHPVSDTFHARDIFAPAAAHLSRGVAPGKMGESVEELVCLNVTSPASQRGIVEGRIVFIDHFGNLVSNIRSARLRGGSVQVEIGGTLIEEMSSSYAEGEGLRALVGSHGYLEIAERNGSAAARLGAGVGSVVRVSFPR